MRATVTVRDSQGNSSIREVDITIADGVPCSEPDFDAVVAPGEDVTAAIRVAGDGGRVLLLDGVHPLSQPLDGLPAVELWGQSRDGTVLRGSGPGGHHLVKSGGPVLFQRLTIERFGPHLGDQNGATISGGTRSIIDCVLRQTNNTLVRWGNGWVLEGVHFEDAGRYALAGGNNGVVRNCTGTRLGTDSVQGVTRASDTNRGFCKFARSKGNRIYGLRLWDVYQGVWWDIANEDGEVWDLEVDGCDRSGLNLEAGYDGFSGGRIRIRNAGRKAFGSEPDTYPAPAAISISLTGFVTLTDVDIDDSRHGVGLLNPAGHAQLKNTANDLSRMGVANVTIAGVVGPGITHMHLGATGSAHTQYPIRQPTGIDLSGLHLPPDARIRRDW